MSGEVRMVDISEKPVTVRTATASVKVRMSPQTARAIAEGKVPKGDVLACARVAAYLAIKKTPELIPLCHPIPISGAEVNFDLSPDEGLLRIEVSVGASRKLGRKWKP
jgi:cyclic pyranopterin phosphate synthase